MRCGPAIGREWDLTGCFNKSGEARTFLAPTSFVTGTTSGTHCRPFPDFEAAMEALVFAFSDTDRTAQLRGDDSARVHRATDLPSTARAD